MTKPANIMMENAVQSKNPDMLYRAFQEGASLEFKAGWYFGLACTYNQLPLIEIFLEQPDFIKKVKAVQKKYDSSFEFSLLIAIANNYVEITQYLLNNKTYLQIINPSEYIFSRLGDICKIDLSNTQSLSYCFQHLNLKEHPHFQDAFNLLSNEKKKVIDNLYLSNTKTSKSLGH